MKALNSYDRRIVRSVGIMGYIYLAIAILSGCIKGFCGKKTSSLTKELSDAILFNLIRMVLCVAIGFCMVIMQNGFKGLMIDAKTLCITLPAGITNSLFIVSWLIAVKYGMYMTVEVSIALGTIIPIILSNVFFEETVSLKQIIGLLILVMAVYIMCSYNAQQKGKTSKKTYLILFICGLANGLTDFSQKLYVSSVENTNISIYNLYIYIFSMLTLVIFCFIFKPEHEKANFRSAGGYILIMAIGLFCYSYFKTKAAMFLPSVQLYPLCQSLALICSAVMASVFFKEKITLKCIGGIALSFIALLFINM